MEHSWRQKRKNLATSYSHGYAGRGRVGGLWNLGFDLYCDIFRRSRRRYWDLETLNEETFCRHGDSRVIRRLPRVIRRCQECQLAFAERVGSLDEAIAVHDGSYFEANEAFVYEEGDIDLFSYMMPRVLFFWSLGFDRLPAEGRRSLDVGCGNGVLPTYLDWLGWDAWGVEISEWAVEFGKQRLGYEQLLQGTVEEQGFEDGRFTLVTLVHVLEHLNDPEATLLECFRILDEDSWIYIEVPCSERDTSDYIVGDHFWFHNQTSLTRLMGSAGFRDLRIGEGTFNPELHNVPFLYAAGHKR